MESNEISSMMRVRAGDKVLHYVNQIPFLELSAKIQPITRTVLKVEVLGLLNIWINIIAHA